MRNNQEIEYVGPKIDLRALEGEDEQNARFLRLLRALALCSLDARNRLICLLSAEGGEWNAGKELVNYAKEYRRLMRRASRIAKDCFEDGDWVLFAVMSEVAKEIGETESLPW